jgi:DNA-binding GntR family transcriptional regulator
MELDPADPRPVYERIADDLRRSITSGALTPGDQLPSLADIKTRYDVSTMTAREAIKVLSNEGIVFVRQGAGAFVSDSPAPEGPERLAQQLRRIEHVLTELDTRVAALEQTIGHGEPPRSPQGDPHGE